MAVGGDGGGLAFAVNTLSLDDDSFREAATVDLSRFGTAMILIG